MLRNLIIRLTSICFLFIIPTEAAMPYPIHLGGFAGDTTIKGFAFDSASNLVATGISTDLQMVSALNQNFVLYLPTGSNIWLWKK